MDPLTYVHRVLTAADVADIHSLLYWRTDGAYAPVTFFAVVSDLFDWGLDMHAIGLADVSAFESALADVAGIVGGGDMTHGVTLYAARARGCRPLNAAYPTDRRLWPLLDAAGPERCDDLTCRPGGLRSHARRSRRDVNLCDPGGDVA